MAFTNNTQNRNSRVRESWPSTPTSFSNNLWRLLTISALAYFIWSDKWSIYFVQTTQGGHPPPLLEQSGGHVQETASFFPTGRASQVDVPQVQMPSGTKGHIAFVVDPGFSKRNGLSADVQKVSITRCQDYVQKYAMLAVAEQKKYGIPASITLAQGLLETNAGESNLAQRTNNHFGIKCFSRQCKKGHCANFTDDSHKDFFVKYSNVWGSYRAHSLFLKQNKRYASLFTSTCGSDYRAWARQLVKCGYATDKKYGDKLIALIHHLQLSSYDSL